ncbi:glycosyltransferase [Aliiroseovarius crassostreae]|uniref:glycosyltransferase n=1 Tax=Aliiroseovarius crassostreae TaxID=154981 RepID=UPI00220F4DD6|nr:glycosyltransferase [Aliiroseovarius crassostreae]UWQ10858.1 glycosyltransferase [Aliiroseovarius crassostreae]
MKVLHLIASVNPNQGGPLAFALNMAHERETHGHSSLFISTDPPDADWVTAFPFPIVTAPNSRRGIERAVTEHCPSCDVAIVHGLWNFASIGGYKPLRRNAVPWLLYPHGMLDPYFRRIKPVKHLIKQVYWLLWQGRMLSGATKVLFTCEEEQTLAQNAFWGHHDYSGIAVRYCAADQKITQPRPVQIPGLPGRDSSRPYLLFLSRIHPKKAVDTLLTAFAQIAHTFPEVDLIIAGPNKNSYADQLKAQTASLGLDRRVFWTGQVAGVEKQTLFAEATAFVLPSHQENFGQVVAEALSAGTPVLISDKVNIHREVSENGVGLVCEDSLQGTKEMLARFLSLPDQDRQAMTQAARPTYERLFSVKSAYADLQDQIEGALGANQPCCGGDENGFQQS